MVWVKPLKERKDLWYGVQGLKSELLLICIRCGDKGYFQKDPFLKRKEAEALESCFRNGVENLYERGIGGGYCKIEMKPPVHR